MTKDEYQDFALRYKGCGACFPMYHTLSRFEKMWFTAIQKDVAELEKEKCELLGIIQGKDKVIQELKKENAELKGIKDIATLIRANNDTVITLMQLNNMLVSKNQQLTKAKEIIKDYMIIAKGAHITECGVPEENRTIHVLKLNEKAEEFLNSEVEK